jgi:hypothetical protein
VTKKPRPWIAASIERPVVCIEPLMSIDWVIELTSTPLADPPA